MHPSVGYLDMGCSNVDIVAQHVMTLSSFQIPLVGMVVLAHHLPFFGIATLGSNEILVVF